MLKFPESDPPEDTELSRDAEWDHDVLHIYNDNYLGIRAAAAALPGRKLALPNLHWDYREHLSSALDMVRASGCTKAVIHGMSNAVSEMATAIHRVLPRIALYGVWHGGPSQWVGSHESLAFGRFLELDHDGVLAASHIMKPGCNQLLLRGTASQLVNCAPKALVPRREARGGIAFVPAPPSLHKNLYGNLCAAELSPAISSVWHYAELSQSPVLLMKARQVSFEGPRHHQQNLNDCTVVMNASTLDCHPMVDLEAAAVGRPSVHMPLNLGVLDDHPLTLLATIVDPGSIGSILAALSRVLELPVSTALEMSLDYAAQMTAASIDRFERFIYG